MSFDRKESKEEINKNNVIHMQVIIFKFYFLNKCYKNYKTLKPSNIRDKKMLTALNSHRIDIKINPLDLKIITNLDLIKSATLPKKLDFMSQSYNVSAEKKSEIEEYENASPIKSALDKSVANCLICFDKAPDAVFMECGHGGILHYLYYLYYII